MVTTTGGRHVRVAIVGGGISGLSAAWYLERQAESHNVGLDYTVIESGDQPGGKVMTETVTLEDGTQFTVEGGPDSFLTQKPWALDLARELGLEDDLLGTNSHNSGVYVLQRGRPVPMPEGVLLIIPTKFMPFALSPLISPLGKLRMGLDLFIPRKRDNADETLADFIKRRLGHEALDKIAEPLMSGIHNSEAERQSVLATFPRFRNIEKEHGSLIRGMLASRRKRAAAPTQSGDKPKISAFTSLKGGTQALTDKLAGKLQGAVSTGVSVTDVTHNDNRTYTLSLSDGTTITADAVIFTTPSYVTADLLQNTAPDASRRLRDIRYVSTATVSLAFRKADVKHFIKGFGMVIPRSENRRINAVTMSSLKFDQRAPEGYLLLRAFVGGSRTPETYQLDDADVIKTVREELADLLDIHAEPVFHRLYRWPHANPQYDVGHLERISAIEAELPSGVYVTGSAYRGVGLPDCVRQAKETAESLMEVAAPRVPDLSATGAQ